MKTLRKSSLLIIAALIILIFSISSCSQKKVQKADNPETTQNQEEVKVVIEDLAPEGDIKYWRDENDLHHVPKRGLEELILDW